MKNKIVCLLACLVLFGCIRAGDYDLAPVRTKLVNSIRGYSIDYADNEEKLVGDESLRENNVVLNKSITVKKGDSILSDKTFDKKTYQNFVYRVNKKGVINTLTYPLKLDNKKDYLILGWVKIDGKKYSILESDIDDYVFLFDEDGNFYKRSGLIEDKNLKLLDEDLFIYPSDLKVMQIAKMRDEISNVKKGYEVKYGGLKLDRVWFDYLDYDKNNQNGGVFEKISFPNMPGLITINGVNMRVLDANEDTLTYIILSDDK